MRVAPTFWLLVATAAGLMAADEPAPPPAPAEDAIAATKRDLESIKASRENTSPQKTDLRLSVPELQSGTAEPLNLTRPKTPTVEKKSANWLLDAMEKKPDARNDRGKGKTELTLLPGETESKAQTRERDETRVAEGKEQKPADATLNPLSAFLSGWMTTQDYALLRPGLENSTAANVASRSGALPTTAAIGFSPVVALDGSLNLAGGNRPAFVPPPPQENPYVQAMISPATAAAIAPANPALPASVSPPAILVPLPNSSPAKSKIPEFAKPTVDDKYFKQLKRF